MQHHPYCTDDNNEEAVFGAADEYYSEGAAASDISPRARRSLERRRQQNLSQLGPRSSSLYPSHDDRLAGVGAASEATTQQDLRDANGESPPPFSSFTVTSTKTNINLCTADTVSTAGGDGSASGDACAIGAAAAAATASATAAAAAPVATDPSAVTTANASFMSGASAPPSAAAAAVLEAQQSLAHSNARNTLLEQEVREWKKKYNNLLLLTLTSGRSGGSGGGASENYSPSPAIGTGLPAAGHTPSWGDYTPPRQLASPPPPPHPPSSVVSSGSLPKHHNATVQRDPHAEAATSPSPTRPLFSTTANDLHAATTSGGQRSLADNRGGKPNDTPAHASRKKTTTSSAVAAPSPTSDAAAASPASAFIAPESDGLLFFDDVYESLPLHSDDTGDDSAADAESEEVTASDDDERHARNGRAAKAADAPSRLHHDGDLPEADELTSERCVPAKRGSAGAVTRAAATTPSAAASTDAHTTAVAAKPAETFADVLSCASSVAGVTSTAADVSSDATAAARHHQQHLSHLLLLQKSKPRSVASSSSGPASAYGYLHSPGAGGSGRAEQARSIDGAACPSALSLNALPSSGAGRGSRDAQFAEKELTMLTSALLASNYRCLMQQQRQLYTHVFGGTGGEAFAAAAPPHQRRDAESAPLSATRQRSLHADPSDPAGVRPSEGGGGGGGGADAGEDGSTADEVPASPASVCAPPPLPTYMAVPLRHAFVKTHRRRLEAGLAETILRPRAGEAAAATAEAAAAPCAAATSTSTTAAATSAAELGAGLSRSNVQRSAFLKELIFLNATNPKQ